MADQQLQVVKGVDQSFRRTWDQEVYFKKAQERAAREEQAAQYFDKKPPKLSQMRPVQAREEDLDLEKNLNKFITVNPDAGEQHAGGFYCEVCNCSLKDSNSYLDHINGKKHQRALGTSLRPERATVDQVRARLKKKKEEEGSAADLFEEKMRMLKEQEEKRRREEEEARREQIRKKKEARRLKKEAQQQQEVDPELVAMGLPTGFGSSKK